MSDIFASFEAANLASPIVYWSAGKRSVAIRLADGSSWRLTPRQVSLVRRFHFAHRAAA